MRFIETLWSGPEALLLHTPSREQNSEQIDFARVPQIRLELDFISLVARHPHFVHLSLGAFAAKIYSFTCEIHLNIHQ